MSGATLFMIYQGFYEATLELVAPTKTSKEPWEILNKIYSGVEKIKKIWLQSEETLRSWARNAKHFQKIIHGYGFNKDEVIKEQTINTH